MTRRLGSFVVPAVSIGLLIPIMPAAGQAVPEADAGPASVVEGGDAVPESVRAPDPSGYVHELAPRATAIPAPGPIELDGRLDEAVWREAPAITDFTQEVPFEGSPSSEATEIRIVYDDDAIYVGALLMDESPITTRLNRRDAGRSDFDYLQVSLDSYHDHETAYRFAVNPSGAIRDAVSSGGGGGGGGGGGRGGGGGGGGDTSWDPVWAVETLITAEGWSAEMRIPFSQLRFQPDDIQVWGIQIVRNIDRNQERATFPFVPTLERGGTSRFAHLDGIEGIEPGQRLELLPYVATRGEYLQLESPAGIDFSNPYRSGSDHFAEAGLDLKYRLTSNVTLDATVNPDFGQVELDPSVINLTAFETRYQERRPFFVEGADIFRFGEGGPAGSTGQGPQLLYSRRIGRAPTGSAPSAAVFSEETAATTILGAAKLTGRMGDGWSLGVLEAVTDRETAPYLDGDQVPGEAVIEPRTNYFVGRLRRQIRGGETRFGVIGSAVNRDLNGSGMEERLHSAAYSGGLDFAHEWSNRTYRISSLVTGSYVQGAPGVISRTQRSSTRYYQRPDADHLDLDLEATSLAGYYAMVDLAKQAGAYTAKIAFAAASPGYEVNDLGFQSASDRLVFDTNVQYSQPNPGRILRSWSARGSPDFIWNYAGDRVFTEVNGNLNFQFLNYWSTGTRLAYNPPYEDDRLTRGGPLGATTDRFSAQFNVSSDSRRTTTGRLQYNWSGDRAGARSNSVNLNLTLKPSERVEVQLGPSLTRRHEAAQYVTSVDDPLATHTFGRRYVFAPLDQTTVSLDTRVNVTFSPTLSLQLYAEPFVSTGDYGGFREFARPGSFSFLDYGSDIGSVTDLPDGAFYIDPDGAGPAEDFQIYNRDFSYRSLLGNAVLRWEWRQGSTLYLVWQQRRIDSRTGYGVDGVDSWVGGFDLNRDVGDMFGTHPDNIFVIKLSYWLNP